MAPSIANILGCRMFSEKLCFVCATAFIVLSTYFFVVRPALILYIFSGFFVVAMVFRVINYWRSNYLLFMLDTCYLINLISLCFIWAFPTCHKLQRIQFGLANAHAYSGAFLFRNALVLHDFQKLVSSFIHILPVLFSYLLRWFPSETSILWYTAFSDTGAKPNVYLWMHDLDWFYVMLIPLIIFTAREILYYLIIYGCVKPSEKHLDSYRYMHKKKLLAHLLWNRFHARWHLLIWIVFCILSSVVVLCLALIAWCSYLFHSGLIIIQLLTISWNGACYYVDYYPIEVQRRCPQPLNKLPLEVLNPEDHEVLKNTSDEERNPGGMCESDADGGILCRLVSSESAHKVTELTCQSAHSVGLSTNVMLELDSMASKEHNGDNIAV
ncbi:hypothetical protein CRM22_004320 [Opisthorchis felineus]|uniref:Glycerophosphocholine acyltransferase 1 n=1 Tax=Opisthorchis felineus TaxID=147828 RepID=A0A4S2LWW1_OPIFE|nr:hypothetical protein CRM22_004320 [Opisthorchis felineus]